MLYTINLDTITSKKRILNLLNTERMNQALDTSEAGECWSQLQTGCLVSG